MVSDIFVDQLYSMDTLTLRSQFKNCKVTLYKLALEDQSSNPVSRDESSRLKCDQCEATFSRLAALKSHIKVTHSVSEAYSDAEECVTGEQKSDFAEIVDESFARSIDSSGSNKLVMYKQNQRKERKEQNRCDGVYRLPSSGADNTGKQAVFTCKVCGYAVDQFEIIYCHVSKNHLLCEPPYKPYCCRRCKVGYMWSKGLKRHNKEQHDGVEHYSCGMCSFDFDSTHLLNKHVINDHAKVKRYMRASIVHSFEEVADVQYCELEKDDKVSGKNQEKRNSASHGDIAQHMKAEKLLTEDGSKKTVYKCKDCSSNTFRYEHIFVHMSKEHLMCPPPYKPYSCETCGRGFMRRHELKKHVNKQHRGFSNYIYKCDICATVFDSHGTRNQHISIVYLNEKPFLCDICGLTVSTSNSLVKHIRIHKKEKPYKCNVCNKRLSEGLRQHMRIHEPAKSSLCNYCGKLFREWKILKSHIKLKHDNQRLHNCSICSKKFSQKIHLQHHINTHTGQKPYKCKNCPKTFASPTQAYNHNRIHQEKTYQCKICKKMFRFASNLRYHYRTHTRERNYKCHVCESLFRFNSNLRDHLKRKHPNA